MQSVPPPGGSTTSAGERRDRITFRRVFAHAARALIELDFASARTIIGLAWRPGSVARDYIIHAQRERYANPVKFAFLASTLYILLNQLTNRSDVAALLDPLQSSQAFWPYALLVALLPAAVLQRLLFRRADLTVAECYTFGLYVFGELALAASALLLLQRFAQLSLPLWPYLAAAGVFSAGAVAGLYADRRLHVWLRAVLVFAFALAVVAGLIYAAQWYRFRSFAF